MQLSMATLVALLGAIGLAVGGALSHEVRVSATFVQTFTSGLLLALVAIDVLPDALSSAPAVDSGWVLTAAAVVMLATFVLLSAGPDVPPGSCCRRGSFGAAAIAAHGLIEGLILGLGLGVGATAGWVLLGAFWLHKLGEGFALVVTLRIQQMRWQVVVGWLSAAAATPVVGAVMASVVTMPGRATPLLSAILAGVIAAVAAAMLKPLLRRPLVGASVVRSGGGLVAGVVVMGVVTSLAR